MVSMIPVRCPVCGANLIIEDNRDKCFCNYCGTQIIIDNSNVTKHYRYEIDEAEIKRVESEERLKNRSLDIEEQRNRIKWILIAIYVGICVLVGLFAFISYLLKFGFTKIFIGLDIFLITVPVVMYISKLILNNDKFSVGNKSPGSVVALLWFGYITIIYLVMMILYFTRI